MPAAVFECGGQRPRRPWSAVGESGNRPGTGQFDFAIDSRRSNSVRRESNPRPPAWHAGVRPTELLTPGTIGRSRTCVAASTARGSSAELRSRDSRRVTAATNGMSDLRGRDSNPQPSAYETDVLSHCTTPQRECGIGNAECGMRITLPGTMYDCIASHTFLYCSGLADAGSGKSAFRIPKSEIDRPRAGSNSQPPRSKRGALPFELRGHACCA